MFEEDYEGVEERTVKIPHIITDRDEFIKDLYDPKKLNQSIKSVDVNIFSFFVVVVFFFFFLVFERFSVINSVY